MVSRYTSPPIELPDPEEPFTRADLIFYGLDHSLDSYEGRVFLNAPDADAGSPREGDTYAGSFWIFGHGGCFGDVGHCDVPVRDDPFDLRPPHQLTPATRTVTVSESLKRLLAAGQTEATVTVVAHTAEDAPDEVLAFEKVRLATYA
jgi:tyrosinase